MTTLLESCSSLSPRGRTAVPLLTDTSRAKDSWVDRERRNLTCTDIALGAKRKGRGRGGGSRRWKTKARGTKGSGSTGMGRGRLAASGQAAFRL